MTDADIQLIKSFYDEIERNVELASRLDSSQQELFEYKLSTENLILIGLKLKDIIMQQQ